jgi:hypothetical protein
MFEVAHAERAGDFLSLEDVLHEQVDRLEQLSPRRAVAHRHAVRLQGPRRGHRRASRSRT